MPFKCLERSEMAKNVFFDVFGPVLETFRWRPPMFLYRFQAPNTLYQMRPTRGHLDLNWASYGTFCLRKISKYLKVLSVPKLNLTRS